jgi:hypothetical protein
MATCTFPTNVLVSRRLGLASAYYVYISVAISPLIFLPQKEVE